MELLLIRHALPSEHLDAIYASPLRRAYQTAQVVAAPHSAVVRVCDGLAEFDRGTGLSLGLFQGSC